MDLSYWEKTTFFNNIDVAIIGSGIVGLNAAFTLKKNNPSLKIVVLERGFLPSGASTKNAGFTCFGSPTELLDDLKSISENELFKLVEKRYLGLQRLRKNLGDDFIDYHNWGGYELFDDEEVYCECSEKINYLNKMMAAITGEKELYIPADHLIKEFEFKHIKHLILNKGEGQIDTGKMMLRLLNKVQELGVIVLNGINITAINDNQIQVDNKWTIFSKKIIVATNGFAKKLLGNDLEVTPARAQVVITSPIENLSIKGTFHFEKGYYYFRNIENRILLGGGRNLDFQGETTTEFGLTELIQNKLEEILSKIILPNKQFTIEHRWSGIMGLGNGKTPIVKKLNPHLYCAVKMGGMGIAIGSLIGEEVDELVSNDL